MKNLPDRFPIRYALLVKSPEIDDELDKLDLLVGELREQEILFRELISIIQKEPLSKKMLLVQKTSARFSISGLEVMNIAKLGKDYDWLEKIKARLKDILPNIKLSSWAFGEAFTLGLYSYEGNYEIPALIKAYNYSRKEDFDSLYGKFGHCVRRGNLNFLYGIYEKIRDGLINEWELYETLNQFGTAIHINSYKSDLWKMLDKGLLDGTIRPEHLFQYETKEIKELTEKNNYKQKISLVVFKNWEELFKEEILVLYKMMNFCNNCGKALPFGYQGKYCPETKENKNCIKERARKRARKKSQI